MCRRRWHRGRGTCHRLGSRPQLPLPHEVEQNGVFVKELLDSDVTRAARQGALRVGRWTPAAIRLAGLVVLSVAMTSGCGSARKDAAKPQDPEGVAPVTTSAAPATTTTSTVPAPAEPVAADDPSQELLDEIDAGALTPSSTGLEDGVEWSLYVLDVKAPHGVVECTYVSAAAAGPANAHPTGSMPTVAPAGAPGAAECDAVDGASSIDIRGGNADAGASGAVEGHLAILGSPSLPHSVAFGIVPDAGTYQWDSAAPMRVVRTGTGANGPSTTQPAPGASVRAVPTKTIRTDFGERNVIVLTFDAATGP